MADKRKPKGNTSGELVNIRFYENQKRQALTTTDLVEGEEEQSENVSSMTTPGTKQTFEICDTVVESDLPPPNIAVAGAGSVSLSELDEGMTRNTCDNSTSELVVSVSSLAISAPSDKSRKGSVDKRIWNLVNLINTETDVFFTTSSCSGRIILYTWEKTDACPSNSNEVSRQKKGCKWLLVSHDEVKPEELAKAYYSTEEGVAVDSANVRDVYFKMEPCILHVQCRTLTSAKKLIHIATESGFRNSGMVVGKENRITVGIRSAIGLEVPLPLPNKINGSNSNSSYVTEEYLTYLTEVANAKMRENWNRSEKLTSFFANTTWS